MLGIMKDWSENNLYDNLHWIDSNQAKIEKRLLRARRGKKKPELFLYDVTSSYLEGNCNAFAEWGYNRDKKVGKKQIVVGLLCDEEGWPVSVEVFPGNTKDTETFGSQLCKTSKRFGCKRMTFVGDRGMIMGPQKKEIKNFDCDFHYISALTKPQIDTLIGKNVIQLDLFDEDLHEVEYNKERYILRRNPVQAVEIKGVRESKLSAVRNLLGKKNLYLEEHSRAWVSTATRAVEKKIGRFKFHKWVSVKSKGRVLELVINKKARDEKAKLNGCYVIHTDLPAPVASTETVHARYKDLSLVEQAFRTCKTAHLEMRPIFVQTEESTRGHAVVVMLAYLVAKELHRLWASIDLTVQEAFSHLSTLTMLEIEVPGTKIKINRPPEPREISQELLTAADVKLPEVLPKSKANVVIRTKLPKRRK